MKGETLLGLGVLAAAIFGGLYLWQTGKTQYVNTPGGLINSPALSGGVSALATGIGQGVGSAISGLGQSIGNALAGGNSSNNSGPASSTDSTFA